MTDPTDPRRTVAAPRDRLPSIAGSTDETVPQGAGKPNFGPPTVSGEIGTLGPYRVMQIVGRGGMGAVFLAIDARLKRKVALKVMLPEFAADREAKERFLREARTAAQISHDNVVTIYEADERDGVPYIAMQFLQGYPLDRFLTEKGPPPLAHVIRIAREAAQGLAAAHAMGLVHRDIKPSNLWLEAPNGRVKLLDFGLAKPVGSDAELTRSGAVMGTPAYMSLEQARGLPVDHRADLYSLGAVLYRLCTGRAPFAGSNVTAVLLALGTEEPTPVRELNPSVPEALARLIHQLLAKNPELRPQTATEVAQRLRAALEQLLSPSAPAGVSDPSLGASASLPVVVHPLPVQPPIVVPMQITGPAENAFANLGDDEEATEAEPDPETPKPQSKKGGKWVLVAAGVASILALAAVAVVLLSGKEKPKPEVQGPSPPPPLAPATKSEPKPPADADRRAAEYLLSVGGVVRVNGGETYLAFPTELPKEPFRLTGLSLHQLKGVTAAGLSPLADCKDLEVVNVYYTPIGDAGAAHFKGCKKLQFLWLIGSKVSDTGLAHFAGCSDLAELNLSDTPTTNAGLVHFKDCTALTGLHLSNDSMTDEGLANFAACKRLTILNLSGSKATDAGLDYFRECADLKSVSLGFTAITDEGVARLTRYKGLTTAMLNNTAVGDAGLAALRECTTLTSLDLRATKVTAGGVEAFRAAVPGCEIKWNGGVIAPKK